MATTGDDTKYELAAHEREHLRANVSPSSHARDQHRVRAPQDAVGVYDALADAVVDTSIAAHPFFAERPEDNTAAVAVYRGRTESGESYGMVYPFADDDPRRGPIAATAYRVRSVPEHAVELAGLPERVGVALMCYLRTLGEQGGIVNE